MEEFFDCKGAYYDKPPTEEASDAIAAGRFYWAKDAGLCAVEVVKKRSGGDYCHYIAWAKQAGACAVSGQPGNPLIFRSVGDWQERHAALPNWPAPASYKNAPFLAISLADARSMISRGIEPIIPLPGLFDAHTKLLLPDYQARLAKMVNDNMDLLGRPGAIIEIVDEVFLNGIGAPKTDTERAGQSASARSAFIAVKALLPNAKVGVVFSPEAWRANPSVFNMAIELCASMDWVGLDPYLMALDQRQADAGLAEANRFADSVARQAKKPQTLLILQGFAPAYAEGPPQTWSGEKTAIFSNFVKKMALLGSQRFDASTVWGWGYANEGNTPGMNFPDALKSSYLANPKTMSSSSPAPKHAGQSYKASPGKASFSGSFYEPGTISAEPFQTGADISEGAILTQRGLPGGSRMDFSALRLAIGQGRAPIISLGFLLDADHRLADGAMERLDRAMSDFPDVFSHPQLIVDVVDEIFWRTSGVAAPADRAAEVALALDLIKLLRSKMPQAVLGINTNPQVWDGQWGYPGASRALLDEMLPVMRASDFVASDPYFWTPTTASAARSVKNAREFADFVELNVPNAIRILVVQGFGPVDFPSAGNPWTPSQLNEFKSAVSQLFAAGEDRYHQMMIWGFGQTGLVDQQCRATLAGCSVAWNDGDGLPDAIKDLYVQQALRWQSLPGKK